jgi:uncharacterized protein YndB with AHSA1/START domain
MLAGKNVEVAVSLPTEREIAFTCRLERSPRLLFEAWTKPEHLKNWWGCEGSTITHCAIDLCIGGSWSLVMRMADGSDHRFHGTYREILPHNRLVYTECYEMPQYGNPEWLTTVTFDESPVGTLVTHTIKHKSREVRDAHLQAGMQQGAIQTLTKLNEYSAEMLPVYSSSSERS